MGGRFQGGQAVRAGPESQPSTITCMVTTVTTLNTTGTSAAPFQFWDDLPQLLKDGLARFMLDGDHLITPASGGADRKWTFASGERSIPVEVCVFSEGSAAAREHLVRVASMTMMQEGAAFHRTRCAWWLHIAGPSARAILACRVERPLALLPGILAVPRHLAWCGKVRRERGVRS